MPVIRVDGRFTLRENLGHVSQSSVFRAVDLVEDDHGVLVKTSPFSKVRNPLQHEHSILTQLCGLPCIPDIIWSGIESELRVLVFEDIGPTLEDLFNSNGRKLPMNTISILAEQLVTCLERIHASSYLYSSINPKTILVGSTLCGKQRTECFLFDFSLVRPYRNPQTHAHMPSGSDCSLPFGARAPGPFSSVNSHLGRQLSRRDDLESLAYLLIYLVHGSLPWDDANPMSNNDSLEQKRDTTISELSGTLPPALMAFLRYTRELEFTQRPDYTFILTLVHGLREESTTLPAIPDVDINACKRTYWVDSMESVTQAVPLAGTVRKCAYGLSVSPPPPTPARKRRLAKHGAARVYG